MAKGVRFELRGVPGLKQAFEIASKGIRRAVTGAVETSTRNVELRAQRNVSAQVNRKWSQGDLASAIGSNVRGIIGRVGIEDVSVPQRGGASSHQNPWAYGYFVEEGFRLEIGNVVRNIPPRPFIQPALEAEDNAHYARVRSAIGSGLSE